MSYKFEGLQRNNTTFMANNTGYSVIRHTISQSQQGTWTIDITLQLDGKNFDPEDYHKSFDFQIRETHPNNSQNITHGRSEFAKEISMSISDYKKQSVHIILVSHKVSTEYIRNATKQLTINGTYIKI